MGGGVKYDTGGFFFGGGVIYYIRKINTGVPPGLGGGGTFDLEGSGELYNSLYSHFFNEN